MRGRSVGRIIRRTPLTEFAEAVAASGRALMRVCLVSPWIASTESSNAALHRLLAAVSDTKARLTVLTRPPTWAGHQNAIGLCAAIDTAEVLLHSRLHAKLYVMESNHLRVALVGSPNLTEHGDRVHRELAIEIRSIKQTDVTAELVEDLFLYSRELMLDKEAIFHKRLGDPAPSFQHVVPDKR